MNKIIKELANMIDENIGNDAHQIHNTEFKDNHLDIIKQFISNYSKSGLFFPYPLKGR